MFSLVACVFDVCTSQECDRSYLSSEIKFDNFSRNGCFRLQSVCLMCVRAKSVNEVISPQK